MPDSTGIARCIEKGSTSLKLPQHAVALRSSCFKKSVQLQRKSGLSPCLVFFGGGDNIYEAFIHNIRRDWTLIHCAPIHCSLTKPHVMTIRFMLSVSCFWALLRHMLHAGRSQYGAGRPNNIRPLAKPGGQMFEATLAQIMAVPANIYECFHQDACEESFNNQAPPAERGFKH